MLANDFPETSTYGWSKQKYIDEIVKRVSYNLKGKEHIMNFLDIIVILNGMINSNLLNENDLSDYQIILYDKICEITGSNSTQTFVVRTKLSKNQTFNLSKIKQDILRKNNCLKWLIKWSINSHDNILYDINGFKKENKIYTVYRGLSWGNIRQIMALNDVIFDKYKIGSYINIPSKRYTSWSTNINVANNFAKNGVSYPENDEENDQENDEGYQQNDYGIVLKINVDSKYILADIPLTCKCIDRGENEVILYPGNYKCEIILIVNRKNGYTDDLSFGLYKIAEI